MSQSYLPTYHFLLIAPNLDAEWLFEAARSYWETFRPTIISDFQLLQLIPQQYTIGVTVVARRDLVGPLGRAIGEINPNAVFDPVVYDFVEDAQLALDGRARLNQPYGVPIPPTPTPLPAPTNTPPVGIPLTREPSGFITQTPTPTAANPQPTPAPIEPTPGAVTGNG